tara:strand:+ start:233 stop:475 length:243 start_codon:yes stop_codon:yes gene_type:complete
MIKATKSLFNAADTTFVSAGTFVSVIGKGVNELDREVDALILLNGLKREKRFREAYAAAGIEYVATIAEPAQPSVIVVPR